MILFSDEKCFDVEQANNRQNHRVWSKRKPPLVERIITRGQKPKQECINEILSTIQSSHRWLYPTKLHSKSEIELSSAVLKNIITDNLLTTEISATQILCFLTLRRNPAFEQIPFCRYRLQDNSTKSIKNTWPGHLLQKHPQMIDELYGAPYQCAYERQRNNLML
ncbi:hypothetical protein ANCDUO_05088 [Ancylostoma duodenale]|uniref:Uncharacterized protein n=1 Tax=Ancylostoma duodenale TaxID=51022 RepID=A0A0C2H5B6_9BILA|nr:hypothetical protein ANCDUO_05088 [Ancylostoma duodenale]